MSTDEMIQEGANELWYKHNVTACQHLVVADMQCKACGNSGSLHDQLCSRGNAVISWWLCFGLMTYVCDLQKPRRTRKLYASNAQPLNPINPKSPAPRPKSQTLNPNPKTLDPQTLKPEAQKTKSLDPPRPRTLIPNPKPQPKDPQTLSPKRRRSLLEESTGTRIARSAAAVCLRCRFRV